MTSRRKRLSAWFFEGIRDPQNAHVKTDSWWRVMCLTGVDYFSSMGFQPGISYLAAGLLSPLATLTLVILTLAGALPAYWLVAKESPHGQGSFAVLEQLTTGWKSKTIVLILLGFATTDFIFTITLCSADASAHIVQNPWFRPFSHDRLILTFALICALGAVFLLGFKEAIRVSFWLVMLYLTVNVIALTAIVTKLGSNPESIHAWLLNITSQHGSVTSMIVASAIAFPQLALGLSGFETGVAVMPLIKTHKPADNGERIRNTRLLLVTVAVIMSLFLLLGSLGTTVLIPPELFKEHGAANGRALAYLTHLYLGDNFGALYDVSTVLILWFAGASGMAALLSLVPQYLPRYGMAPDWASARRPLVVFFTLVSLIITFLFGANVDAQAGAFATGLLVLITSAIVAITFLLWRKQRPSRFYFAMISAAFVYACLSIMWERPDGLKISLIFVALIVLSSFISRSLRCTELRIGKVIFDETAERFIRQACSQHMKEIRLLAHRPGHNGLTKTEQRARSDHSIQECEGNFILLEVIPADASEFINEELPVSGHEEDGYQILRCTSAGVPNAIAAILLHLRDTTKQMPHVYMGWTEGHPIAYITKYVLFGEGETAPLTREILRSAEPDDRRRPKVHVA